MKKKILIVDDQESIRKMLRLTFRGRFDLHEASDTAEAWDIVRHVNPDAIILDVMMPGEMDGYQFCEKLRQEALYKGIHVLMVTARGQEADRRRGTESGANAYFVKPFSPLAIARHLEKVLGVSSEG